MLQMKLRKDHGWESIGLGELCVTLKPSKFIFWGVNEEICVNSFNIDKGIKVNSIMKTKLWWVLSKLIHVQYQHFPGKPPFIWKSVFPGSWYLLQMLFAFFQWSDSLCLWQSSHRLFSNLESLLFLELRLTKTNLIMNDVYLNAAIVPNQSWSRLEQGHFCPIGVFLKSFLPFFPSVPISLSRLDSAHICSHCSPLCPYHISPSDRALICSTSSQQSGLPNNAMTKKIWKLSCGNLCQSEGSLCKCLSVNFSRVSSEWLGMARVPPPPSSAYWPPHSHVRFFSDNTSEPVLVGQQPPPSLLSHRLSQEAAAPAVRLPHTHTHGSQSAKPCSHIAPSAVFPGT